MFFKKRLYFLFDFFSFDFIYIYIYIGTKKQVTTDLSENQVLLIVNLLSNQKLNHAPLTIFNFYLPYHIELKYDESFNCRTVTYKRNLFVITAGNNCYYCPSLIQVRSTSGRLIRDHYSFMELVHGNQINHFKLGVIIFLC